ncbi:hypothetical protein [Niallia circulans]|uniref:hypothetical protein n=1 Tax=Niallia circulans TaxID=1397 RepID=UPI001594F266|nr:hypothetical protein [Niallia circulans]
MTKLEELLNQYYVTDNLSLTDIIYQIREDQEHNDVVNEFVSLLGWLNKQI